MATATRRRRAVKQDDSPAAEAAGEVVRDQIEELARTGARDMLMAAMSEEVDAYLGRCRYQGDGEFRGYRNGTTPRRLTAFIPATLHQSQDDECDRQAPYDRAAGTQYRDGPFDAELLGNLDVLFTLRGQQHDLPPPNQTHGRRPSTRPSP